MMIWVFIFMELLAFGLAFIVFLVLREKSLAVFESSLSRAARHLSARLHGEEDTKRRGVCGGGFQPQDRQRLLAHVRPDLGAPLSNPLLDLRTA
jgi:hypothetical protein